MLELVQDGPLLREEVAVGTRTHPPSAGAISLSIDIGILRVVVRDQRILILVTHAKICYRTKIQRIMGAGLLIMSLRSSGGAGGRLTHSQHPSSIAPPDQTLDIERQQV